MCETFLVEPTPVNCHVIFWKAAYSGRKGVDRVFQLFHVLIPIPSYNFSFIMRNKNHLKFYLKNDWNTKYVFFIRLLKYDIYLYVTLQIRNFKCFILCVEKKRKKANTDYEMIFFNTYLIVFLIADYVISDWRKIT